MSTIDLKLKSYDELIFEITTLNTNNYLLQQKVEQLEKENNDLRRTYQNTYKKYLENGNDEMARYFMAQIDACPTFYVAPIIDYYKEYNKLENIRKEVMEYIEKDKLNIDESQCYVETQTGWKMIPKIYEDLLNILNKRSDKE